MMRPPPSIGSMVHLSTWRSAKPEGWSHPRFPRKWPIDRVPGGDLRVRLVIPPRTSLPTRSNGILAAGLKERFRTDASRPWRVALEIEGEEVRPLQNPKARG